MIGMQILVVFLVIFKHIDQIIVCWIVGAEYKLFFVLDMYIMAALLQTCLIILNGWLSVFLQVNESGQQLRFRIMNNLEMDGMFLFQTYSLLSLIMIVLLLL